MLLMFSQIWLKCLLFCRLTWICYLQLKRRVFQYFIPPIGDTFELLPTGLAAKITYQRQGQNYTLYVPFHRNLIRENRGVKFFLELEDNTQREITQQPGIPMLVNAEELGGKNIIRT